VNGSTCVKQTTWKNATLGTWVTYTGARRPLPTQDCQANTWEAVGNSKRGSYDDLSRFLADACPSALLYSTIIYVLCSFPTVSYKQFYIRQFVSPPSRLCRQQWIYFIKMLHSPATWRLEFTCFHEFWPFHDGHCPSMRWYDGDHWLRPSLMTATTELALRPIPQTVLILTVNTHSQL